jgi:hypothetical protein
MVVGNVFFKLRINQERRKESIVPGPTIESSQFEIKQGVSPDMKAVKV